MEVEPHAFLTSASDEGERSDPHPRHLTYGHPLNSSGPQRQPGRFGEEEPLDTDRNQTATLGRPVHSKVAVPTDLSRLSSTEVQT